MPVAANNADGERIKRRWWANYDNAAGELPSAHMHELIKA